MSEWHEDERAIGLKVIFTNDPNFNTWATGSLHKVSVEQIHDYFFDEDGGHYKYCRLAQGDKTPYDGKGQPVPDDVMVAVWWWNGAPRILKATHAAWHKLNCISHYQVQEEDK
ncbi:MAG: hypothetical protein JKY52_09635 [Flavobacteriales bacterium]|nr:hypothetical protein [Flavobacteriales bacterium]